MKVILTQDVAKIGRHFDVVEVADGYGLNKLIPQGMALPATPANLKKVEAEASKTAANRAAADASFAEIVKSLAGKVVDVKVEANEDGKLYQALKVEAVIEGVKEAEAVVLTPELIIIKSPIKQLGEHTIELHSGDQSAELILNVIAK